MKPTMRTGAIGAVLTALVLGACASEPSGPASETAGLAAGDPVRGEVAFENNCARCHGQGAKGTDQGPTFLSDIYIPSHHGDAAFQLAPRRGVQPHHWDFGAMPVIEGITDEEIADVIAYVRQLQTEAGLIP